MKGLIFFFTVTTMFFACEPKKDVKEAVTNNKKDEELYSGLLSNDIKDLHSLRFSEIDELFSESTYKERLSEYLLIVQLMNQRRIEQNIPIIQPDSLYNRLDTTTLFLKLLSAAKLINQNRLYEAKKFLKEVINSKICESQITLYAWNDLRLLGEQPVKTELEGIIFEIPLKNAFSYLAIYKDKSAEYKYIEYTDEFPSSKTLRTLDSKATTIIDKSIFIGISYLKNNNLKKGRTKSVTDNFRISFLTIDGIFQIEKSHDEFFTSTQMKNPESEYALLELATRIIPIILKQSEEDTELAKLEEEAKAAKIGIWSQPNPDPLWEFRSNY